MRFLAVFSLVCLAATTLACPPPLKDPGFVGNATFTSAELLKAAPQQKITGRWVDAIDAVTTLQRNRHYQRWPRDPVSNTYIIWYCYEDQSTYEEMNVAVDAALKLWYDKIDRPGVQSGHALEVRDGTNLGSDQPWCRLQPPHPDAYDADRDWNPKHGPATVVIRKGKPHNIGAVASTGYYPEAQGGDHYVVVDLASFHHLHWASAIAHEFGTCIFTDCF